MESSPPIPPVAMLATTASADPWNHAIRVAFLTSTAAAAAFVVLYRFLGVSPWITIPALVFAGWVVGCHLPAVRAGQTGPGGGLALVSPLAPRAWSDDVDDLDDGWQPGLAA